MEESSNDLGTVKKWVAPIDKNVACINAASLHNKIDLHDINNLTSLKGYVFDSCSLKPEMEKSQIVAKKCMLEFDDIVFPSMFPICPDVSTIKTNMQNDKLYILIYSKEGYNFSAEFEHVYKGKMNKNTLYDDTYAICKRALLAIDPSLENDNSSIDSYVEYILCHATWEISIANTICSSTLNIQTPKLPITCKNASNIFSTCKVFIGRISQNHPLCFWVRVCPFIEKQKRDTFNQSTTEDYKNIISSTRFCYYRRFELVKNIVDSVIGNSSKADPLKHVLPPPKPPNAQDISLFLCFSQLNKSETFIDMFEFGDDGDNVLPVDTDVLGVDSDKWSHGSVRYTTSSHLEPSACAELVGWGHNSYSCLGIEGSDIIEPKYIPTSPCIPLERISMIACSPNHTILLSKIGNLYACGENSEGALGLGDVVSRNEFSLIPFVHPVNSENIEPPKIIKVAAGSGSIGSHSVALDSHGRLYAWGVAYSCGLGTTKPKLTPALVTLPTIDSNYSNVNLDLITKQVWKDVACGGGFTIAILKSGKVCSMGMWAHGRLGLGDIPINLVRRLNRTSKKAARYQLSPCLIPGIENAVSVACGDSHTLCLLENGSILSWGKNSCGQLGTGISVSGFLRDEFRPKPVAPFIHNNNNNEQFKRCKMITTGSYHSIAVDTNGFIWTWGAKGSACLGHSDPLKVEGEWNNKINAIFPAGGNSTEVMVPYEILNWSSTWCTPRRIEGIEPSSMDICQISAGDLHTAFLTISGHIYLVGTGPVVPPYIPNDIFDYEVDDNEVNDNEVNDNEVDGSSTEESKPNSEKSFKSLDNETQRNKNIQKLMDAAIVVSTPRRPCASWLTSVSSRRNKLISSSGTRIFILQDEETVTFTLTNNLLRKALVGRESFATTETPSVNQTVIDSLSLESYADSNGTLFEQRGKADCMIIASGKVLLAHRAILAHRSQQLREMIEMETPSDGVTPDQPVQILLPELHYDTAKGLLVFIYTDVLPSWCSNNVSILRALSRVGKSLKIPRLQLLSDRLLHLIHAIEMESFSVSKKFEVPPGTLSKDLGSIVGETQFADVRFIAEGRSVMAHRFILESRCDYFRAMFRSSMNPTNLSSNNAVDVVVPDTFVGFLRLLIFLYTDTLPDGSDGALLEDIMSADRYNLIDMRTLIESMLVPSRSNWLDLLRTADSIGSNRLMHMCLCFLRDNFAVLNENILVENDDGAQGVQLSGNPKYVSAITIIKDEFPWLLENILLFRKNLHASSPSKLLVNRLIVANKRDNYPKQSVLTPIIGIVLIITSLPLYNHCKQYFIIGPFVPIVNTLCVIFIFYMMYCKLKQ